MFDEGLREELRAVVLRFRAGEQRRAFAPVLHVGALTGPAAAWCLELGRSLDPALRTDVVATLLEHVRGSGVGDPAVWLTRPGVPRPHDEDVAWSGPADRAFAAAGLTPRCVVVVTKTGWYSPRCGTRSEWKRPRARTTRQ